MVCRRRQSSREMVRQQYTFRPPGTTGEVEDYTVALDGVTHVVRRIVPDITDGEVRATLAAFRPSCHAWRRRLLLPATHSLRARPCASDVACALGERRTAFTSIPVSCLMIMEWGMPQGDSIAIFCMDVDQQRREDLIHGQGVVDTQRSPEPDVHRLHRQKAQAPWLARLDSWARACRGTCRPGAAPGGR